MPPVIRTRENVMRKRNGWTPFLYAARLLGANMLLLLMLARPVSGQHVDSFEGGAPRWALVESDCQAQLTESEISQVMPHGGRTSELLELACGSGTRALLAYPIEPSIVLDEFQPRIWVRCSSGQIRLGLRVVFPEGRHPVTGGRLTTLLWGTVYTTPGYWQSLQVTGVEKLLNESIIELRQRLGSELELDGGYIDSLVVNAYTGPGRYRLQIDDLNLKGLIPLSATGARLPDDWRQRWRWRQAVPSAEQRFWASVNRPPVWIQHTGESYPWLQSLGISGVLLNQLPGPQQLAKIRASDLSVICPPPAHAVAFSEADAAAIKGWLVGAALDAGQAERAREQAGVASRLGESLKRPLVGEALERHWQFARIADEIFVPQPSRTSAGTWKEKQVWLASKLDVVRPRAEGWVSVHVDLGSAIRRQYTAVSPIVDPSGRMPSLERMVEAGMGDVVLDEAILQDESLGADAPDPISDPLGFRHQVASAVIAGARGILLRTTQPLVDGQVADHALIAAVRWTNNDLILWGPWMVAGKREAPPGLSREDYAGTVLSVSDSQLVIAGTVAENSQYCVPATRDQPLVVELPRLQTMQQVIRLGLGRLETIPFEVTRSGYRFRVDQPLPIESFVVTSNPLVLNFVRQHMERVASSNAVDQLDVASYNLATASKLVDSRFARGASDDMRIAAARPLLEQLASAQMQISQAAQAVRTGQVAASTELASRASDTIQAVLYDCHRVAVGNLAAAQSSPFVLCPQTLHLHWLLADACSRSTWTPVALPGAEFQNLNRMLESGWTQQRREKENVDLRVELIPPGDGGGGLRMAAYQQASPDPSNLLEGGYEGATLRIRSASAQVAAGSLVRLSAMARILRSTRQADSGMLVYDNQAGPSLGQLVQGEQGQRVPIEMYRFMVAGDEFRILAECRGECDVVLENIQISAIKPAQSQPNYITTPVSIRP